MKTTDIYFQPAYGKLYEEAEGGTLDTFTFSTLDGTITHSFIKREIPEPIDGETYYDIVTPYGYGGPVIAETAPDADTAALTAAFETAFKRYCQEHNIVTEFIRFHPLIGNGEDFQSIYDSIYDRDTVGTNLKDYDDPFQAEFSTSARNDTRRALRNGVTYRVIERPDNLDTFKEIYNETMLRNNADDYYFFSDDYFQSCLNEFRDNLLTVEVEYDEKIIGIGLFFRWGEYLHSHLPAARSEYQRMGTGYVINYAVTQWGKENGYSYIHYGGGRSSSPDDNLFKFKKQFGKHTRFPFYIGKKVWNADVYNAICRQTDSEPESSFFPPYAKKLVAKTRRNLERQKEGVITKGGAS